MSGDHSGAAGTTGAAGAAAPSVYERLGGRPFFEGLVERFYAGVAGDPVLRPLYPDDLTDAKANLCDFLIQYWGGPDDYSRRRGHPMLRARHLPFVIGRRERDAWMAHMTGAVEAGGAPTDLTAELLGYFERAATHLLNAETPKGHLPIVPARNAPAPGVATRNAPAAGEAPNLDPDAAGSKPG